MLQIFILPLSDFFLSIKKVFKTGQVVKASKQKWKTYKQTP